MRGYFDDSIIDLQGDNPPCYKNMSDFFNLSWTEIKSAVVYAVLTALVAMGMYALGIGDIFTVSIKPLVNIGAMSLLVGMISIIKNLLTTYNGKFIGSIQVK